MDQRIKILLVGPNMVGKSSIFNNLRNEVFSGSYAPTPLANLYVASNGSGETCDIYDTTGDKNKIDTIATYTQDAPAIFVVLDPLSLRSKENTAESLANYLQHMLMTNRATSVFFILNKCDEKGWNERKAQVQGRDSTEENLTKEEILSKYREVISILDARKKTDERLKYQSNNEIIEYSARNAKTDELNPIVQAIMDVSKNLKPTIQKKIVLNELSEPREMSNNSSLISFGGFLKLLILFAFVSTLALSGVGFFGGINGMWVDIDTFFNAISLVTDWGMGVVVASGVLAAIVTGMVAYQSLKKGTGENDDSLKNLPDNGEPAAINDLGEAPAVPYANPTHLVVTQHGHDTRRPTVPIEDGGHNTNLNIS